MFLSRLRYRFKYVCMCARVCMSFWRVFQESIALQIKLSQVVCIAPIYCADADP